MDHKFYEHSIRRRHARRVRNRVLIVLAALAAGAIIALIL